MIVRARLHKSESGSKSEKWKVIAVIVRAGLHAWHTDLPPLDRLRHYSVWMLPARNIGSFRSPDIPILTIYRTTWSERYGWKTLEYFYVTIYPTTHHILHHSVWMLPVIKFLSIRREILFLCHRITYQSNGNYTFWSPYYRTNLAQPNNSCIFRSPYPKDKPSSTSEK